MRAPVVGHSDTLWGGGGVPWRGSFTLRSLALVRHAPSATEQVSFPPVPLWLVGALETATTAARCRRPPRRCARRALVVWAVRQPLPGPARAETVRGGGGSSGWCGRGVEGTGERAPLVLTRGSALICRPGSGCWPGGRRPPRPRRYAARLVASSCTPARRAPFPCLVGAGTRHIPSPLLGNPSDASLLPACCCLRLWCCSVRIHPAAVRHTVCSRRCC